jgi:YidC/Oxa1 family membrane protein insertase
MLWLAFAFVLFLMWQAWEQDHAPAPTAELASANATLAPRASVPTVALPAAPNAAPTAAATPSGAPTIAAPTAPAAAPAPSAAPVVQGQRLRVRTDVLDLEIDTLGGDLVGAELLDYALAKGQAPRVRLLSAEGLHRAAVRAGLRGADGTTLDHRTLWTAGAAEFALAEGADELAVVLTAPLGEGLVAEKAYTFRRGDYAIALTLRVRNAGAAAWRGDAYVQLDKHLVPIERSIFSAEGYSYEGVAYHDGTKYQKLASDDLDEKAFEAAIAGGWIANLQHYFLVAALPTPGGAGEGAAVVPTPSTYFARSLGELDYVAGFVMPAQDVAAGGAGEFRTTLYVGPKLQDRLEHVAPGLELSTDYGMFTIFAQPLFWLLEKLHWLFGNWGWAIVGLTVLIKVAFYKLSETSGRSMAKMRTVAPKLEQLKERYKDDRQKLNEAMLELYRKEKINPVSGCLPILLTLPVFIALYWVLLESVEMRQAPWILWIDDLSAKDPYFVLPLLMGAAMWAQMKLNPPPPDPVQAKVMQVMPIMFTGMSAFFPAGLTLYWLVNTALSVAQQWQINRVVEKEAAARRA